MERRLGAILAASLVLAITLVGWAIARAIHPDGVYEPHVIAIFALGHAAIGLVVGWRYSNAAAASRGFPWRTVALAAALFLVIDFLAYGIVSVIDTLLLSPDAGFDTFAYLLLYLMALSATLMLAVYPIAFGASVLWAILLRRSTAISALWPDS